MFFFDEAWRKYVNELGLQQMADSLKEKGYGYEWPLKVYGPEDGATFHPGGGRFHKSLCPCYESGAPRSESKQVDCQWQSHNDSNWWAGGFGAVQCRAAGELLPGAVYETMCEKAKWECPFRCGGTDEKPEEAQRRMVGLLPEQC